MKLNEQEKSERQSYWQEAKHTTSYCADLLKTIYIYIKKKKYFKKREREHADIVLDSRRSGPQFLLLLFFFVLFFVQLYRPIGISPTGNSGCFPLGKAAATESRYPTQGACWAFQRFHNPPNTDTDYGIFNVRKDVNACDCTTGMYGHHKRVCTES